ncbi:type II toxin-antitoxin system PemK/MazF family toxin [Agriterribacter sp.]|uniref:type II toxin-antitoxin system PemK/MazF family toxin n=1 Tax=Agriterribacter sp. TaxID=2821509 RepID=UPI002CC43073|nr:type II toxin-antitoxin system PemK/MazF family toxin [Agriterribacter sp.]HTN09142.1 type II toxin-antitoxin system PemK/MazF family toxin [Agriterribacter sp.]
MEQVNQYEIVLVNLDPTIGSEMKKSRSCVILSPNEMNKYLQTIVVAPMTSSSKPYPTRVEVKHKVTKGWIAIDQIRTIDRIRIVKRFETLTDKETDQVKSVIKETFVD